MTYSKERVYPNYLGTIPKVNWKKHGVSSYNIVVQ